MQNLLTEIRAKNPYPDDIFTEPTKEEWKQVQKIFKDAGLVQDKFFGSFGRKVWNRCVDLIDQEIEELKEIIIVPEEMWETDIGKKAKTDADKIVKSIKEHQERHFL